MFDVKKQDRDITRRDFLYGAALASVVGLSAIDSDLTAQTLPPASNLLSPDYSAVIDRIKEKVPAAMTSNSIPGVSIALIDGNGLIWAGGFGYTDLSKKVKVTETTLFSTQSISKTYTALGVLRAIDSGMLGLDDRLKKYLPTLSVNSRFGGNDAEKITIRHLLGHWSGLCHEAPVGNNYDECRCTFDDHIKSISDSWLVAPVGKRFSYSNLGIDLAGYLLQLRSRRPFEEFMKNEVFRPLRMTSSTFSQKEATNDPLFAKGHIGADEVPNMLIPMIPAGGMYSSVTDMARFVSFQLQNGKVNGKRLVSERSFKEMITPQFSVAGQVGGYGLGVYNVASFGATKMLHSGGGYGFSADQRWIPEYGVGAVVLTNQERGSLAPAIANSVLELMIKAKYVSVPQTKPNVSTSGLAIKVDPGSLQRLEGTYKSSGDLVTFRSDGGDLLFVSGNEKVRLEAQSPKVFTSGSRKYAFDLNENGKPNGVQVIDLNYSSNGVEYWPLNDAPTDVEGPSKPDYRDHVGEYTGTSYGKSVQRNVVLRNGYLYIDRNGGLRLNEFRPGLFFTADGEAVIFHNSRMSLGNRPFLKKR